MPVFPPLVDLIRSYNATVNAGTSLFDDEPDFNDPPTQGDVARLFKRAMDARKQVKKEVSKAWQADTFKRMKHFETYGKASCRFLCQRIATDLPRELRDMIYDHILEDEPRNVYATTCVEPTYSSTSAHYWRKEYVGEAMLRELLQNWYAVVRVHIGLDLRFLGLFLTSKVPFVNESRYCLVRKISITLDNRDVTSCSLSGFDGSLKSMLPVNSSLMQLNQLTRLAPGSSIHIYAYHRRNRVYIDARYLGAYRERLLRDLAMRLFDQFCQLKRMGYSVSLGIKDGRAPCQPVRELHYRNDAGNAKPGDIQSGRRNTMGWKRVLCRG